MQTYDQLKLENQFCFTVYTLSRKIIQSYKPHLDKIGLTYTQYITMLVLWEYGTLSVKRIGELLQLDSGTLTPLLKKLENQNFVERKRDKNDERNLLIKLTKSGELLKEEAKHIPESLLCGINVSLEPLIKLKYELDNMIENVSNCK